MAIGIGISEIFLQYSELLEITETEEENMIGGRLTLESGVPVPIADQSAKTTLYYSPYNGDKIKLYDGSLWNWISFSEKSLSLSGLTASTPYDIWGYLSSGDLALEALAWTDGTNRATALAFQDGAYVKSGDATRRYLGSIYINSSGGQTEDTETQRFVWNYHNRVNKNLYKLSTTSHSYTSTSYRPWNNDTANRVSYFMGVTEDNVFASIQMNIQIDGPVWRVFGLGVDTIGNITNPFRGESPSFDYNNVTQSYFLAGVIPFSVAGLGFHYLQAMQKSGAGVAAWQSFYLTAQVKC